MSEWFKDSIIYQIFIDRFAGYKNKDWKKPIFLGGNIKGIIEKIPYLEELGVNTIWLSPHYKTSAYHGYHVTDFFEVDPNFGTLKDLKKLIKELHKKDMHIIADFVPNHCSYKHPFFLEAQKDKKSEYFDWFYFKEWPDDYVCFLEYRELPKLNLDNKATREHIIKSAKYWLSIGFDGFRLDHVLGPSDEFWLDFRNQIKKDYPDSILIGEAVMFGIKFNELYTLRVKNKHLKWFRGHKSDSILKSYIGILDGVLDFRFQELMNKFVAHKNFFRPEWLLDLKLIMHFSKYPRNYYLPTFLDNHDQNRFLFEASNDKEKLKQAAEKQFSLEQPPIIYYGTEIGMSQPSSMYNFSEHGDLQARRPMQWDNQDKEILEFYKKLIKERTKN